MKRTKLIGVVLILAMLVTSMLVCPSAAFAQNAPGDQSYAVKAGDVLWKIGAKFGFTWQELAEYNQLKNPHLIFPEQKIYLPTIAKIDILTTNDFHGALEGGSEAGAAKLAAYMNYYKLQNPKGTVIVDGGDAFQGTPVSNVNRGKPVVEEMSLMGYDAMAVGNHEFDWGIDAALGSLKGSTIKVLASNVYEKGSPVTWATPYTIVDRGGIKIGIIGFSTPETSISASANYVGAYEFKDPMEIANKLIPEVKAKGADVVILLGHIPGKQDSKTNIITGALADLANGAPTADAVIGGHSHEAVAGLINGIPVVEAVKSGRMIGHITLSYDRIKKQVVDKKAELIEVRNGTLAVEPSKDAQAIVDKYNKELEPIFGEVIGKTKTDIVTDYNNESPAGNWVSDATKESAGAQIAFTNAGGMRDNILKGNITLGQIYKVMPFDNTIMTGEMTGKQIKAVLEQSVTLFKGMMQISGIKFTYDSSKPDGQKVVDIKLADGTAMDPDTKYTVATSDFLAGGQDGFVTLKDIQWKDTFILLRDALAKDIRNKGEIAPAVDGRIKNVAVKVSSLWIDWRLAA